MRRESDRRVASPDHVRVTNGQRFDLQTRKILATPSGDGGDATGRETKIKL